MYKEKNNRLELDARFALPGMIFICLIIALQGSYVFSADFTGAALKAGTTGIGADVTVSLYDNLNLRAGLNYLPYTHDSYENDEKEMTGKLRLQTIPLLADWHPGAGNFRVSGGLVINNNKVSVEGVPGAEIEFNDVDYIIQSFNGDMTFNTLCPYIGIGYGNAAREGGRFSFSFDFGVFFHGTPKIRAEAVAADPARQEALDRDLEVELDDLRDDAEPFKFYPVLRFGLLYRF